MVKIFHNNMHSPAFFSLFIIFAENGVAVSAGYSLLFCWNTSVGFHRRISESGE